MKFRFAKLLPTILFASILGLPSASNVISCLAESSNSLVFTKIESTDLLSIGDEIIFVNEVESVAVTKGLTSNTNAGKHFLDSESVVLNDNTASVSTTGNIETFTVVEGNVSGTFGFANSDGKYLASYFKDANGLKYETSLSNASSWTVDLSAKNLSLKSNISGASATSYIYLQYNTSTNDFRMYKSSSNQSPICIYKYTSGKERVELDATEKDVYLENTIKIKANPVNLTATSYAWTTSDESKVSIVSGATSDEVVVKGVAVGDSTIEVTVNNQYKASCKVTVVNAGYEILSLDKYFILNSNGSSLLNPNDLKISNDFDLSNENLMISFEKAYLGNETYYLLANGKYITRAKEVNSKAQNTAITLTSDKNTYWTLSGSSTTGYSLSDSFDGSYLGEGNDGVFRSVSGKQILKFCTKLTFDQIIYKGTLTKSSFTIGESFNPSGLTFYSKYTDGTELLITSKISWDALVSGTKATGTVSVGGVIRNVEVNNLTIFAPVSGSLTVDGVQDTYYIGEKIDKDSLLVKVSYSSSTSTELRTISSDNFEIAPSVIASGTTSIRISLKSDSTIYKDFPIEAIKNSYVATGHIEEGDVITIGTLGYGNNVITGGEELDHNGATFTHSSFNMLPDGKQTYLVGKTNDGYFTFKNTVNGNYLLGDSSTFKYADNRKHVDILSGTFDYTAKVNGRDCPITFNFEEEGYYTSNGGYFTDFQILNGEVIFLEDGTGLLGYDVVFFEPYKETSETIELSWVEDGGGIRLFFEAEGTTEISDEAKFNAEYDEINEEWLLSSKAHPGVTCYYNSGNAGKFGFYSNRTSSYYGIMLFRDNSHAYNGGIKNVNVGFYEGFGEVTVGETFDWISSLKVTVSYNDNTHVVAPVGGYEIILPNTSIIGDSTGYVIFGDKSHSQQYPFKVKVTGHTQAFVIKGDRDPILVNEECQLRVEPAPAEGEDIIWSVDAPQYASISSTGLLKGLTPGYVNVTATSLDEKYSDTVKIRIYRQVESVSLDKHTAEIEAGNKLTLTATVLPLDASNKNVKFSSDDPTVAYVDEKTGEVQGVKPGTATITCAAENHPEKNYDTCVITVKEAQIIHVTSISLDTTSLEVEINKTTTLGVIFTPSDATVKEVTWSSNHENIATVDSSGKVKGIAKGECVITATSVDGKKTASCTVKVKTSVAPVEPDSVSLDKTSVSLDVAESEIIKLIATVSPTSAVKNLTWSSSNEDVAIVDSSGNITPIDVGECNITVTTSNGKTASCLVTVINSKISKVTGVELNAEEVELSVGETFKLIADVIPENADNVSVTWKSSDKNVVTVSTKGLVTAKGEGTATITVTTKDGGFTATCKINVSENKTVNSTTIIIVASSVTVVGLGVGLGVGIPVSIHKKRKKLIK